MISQPPSNIGTHCSLPSCSTLDFLPIKCNYCSTLFCRHHSSPSLHNCPKDSSLNTRTIVGGSRVRDGPELKELLPDRKRGELETKGDEADEVKLSRQQLALAALKRDIDAKKQHTTSTATTGTKGGTTEKKVNPTIALMKLKQKAKSADPRKRDGDVPMLERLYLTVKLVQGEEAEEKGLKEVWVQKSISGGKVLDIFADLFQVTNVNNIANSDPSKLTHTIVRAVSKRLSLALPTTPPSPITLSNRIDSSVSNGSTILLYRGVIFP